MYLARYTFVLLLEPKQFIFFVCICNTDYPNNILIVVSLYRGEDLVDSHAHKNGHSSEFSMPSKPEEEKVNGKSFQNAMLSVDINYDFSPEKNTGCILNVHVKQACSNSISTDAHVDGNMQSDLSGYAADISKTVSACSSTYVPLPPSALNRLSQVSSTSGSSFASSTAPVPVKKCEVTETTLTKKRIEALKKRWQNSDMLYIILDYLDKYMSHSADECDVPRVEVTVIEEISFKAKPPRTTKGSKRRGVSTEEPDVKRTKIEPKPGEFIIGSTVFAKWHDSKYYAGKVISKVSNNKWLVEFYDGKTKNVGTKQIIENYLHLVFGRRVMLMKDERARSSPALIVDCKVIKDEPMLFAVTNHGDYQVPLSQVYFTEQHLRQVKAESEDLQLRNSPTKHCRVTRSQMKTNSPVPCSSGFRNNLRSPSSSEVEDADPQWLSPKYIAGCEPEVLSYTPTPESRIKLKNISGKLPKSSTEIDDNVVGPLITGDWFKGMNFLLTCSERCIEMNVSDEIATDNEDYQFTKVPFVSDRLELQIKLGGGRLYTSVDDIKKPDFVNTYLVAPKPCLTTKYVECLVIGISPVCHEWIVNCCKQQKKLPVQEIPLGWCIENQKFINEYDRKRGLPFRGLKILIAYNTSDRSFYDFWAKILSAGGADVSRFSADRFNVDMILVECGLRDDSLATAAANGVYLVSTTWVIQSLIHGKSRNPDKHAQYHPSYDDYDNL